MWASTGRRRTGRWALWGILALGCEGQTDGAEPAEASAARPRRDANVERSIPTEAGTPDAPRDAAPVELPDAAPDAPQDALPDAQPVEQPDAQPTGERFPDGPGPDTASSTPEPDQGPAPDPEPEPEPDQGPPPAPEPDQGPPPALPMRPCGEGPDALLCAADALCQTELSLALRCVDCHSVAGPVCYFEGPIENGGVEYPSLCDMVRVQPEVDMYEGSLSMEPCPAPGVWCDDLIGCEGACDFCQNERCVDMRDEDGFCPW